MSRAARPFAQRTQPEERRAEFAAFADQYLVSQADEWDGVQKLPDTIIQRLAESRYMVATLPLAAGGSGMDMLAYGMLAEEIGRGCASVRNLIGVQGMVAHTFLKWGTKDQADRWVPRIATGAALGAFALTEPETGSDAQSGTTTAVRDNHAIVLDGHKKWISFGMRADLFLVCGRLEGETALFLVERNSPGLSAKPLSNLLGLRASELAELSFDRCRIPAENLVAHGRLVFPSIVTGALDYGRYSTACGSVGLAQACLTASMSYARERRQFGVPIGEHQLVRRMLTNMVVSVNAARLLCRQAGLSRTEGNPEAVFDTLVAKYFASKAAFQTATDALQIHGANGCGSEYSLQRHLRDAKIQEIIEGTSQIHELQIADIALRARSPNAASFGYDSKNAMANLLP